MSRYRAPRLRVIRALGVPLSGLTRKSPKKRSNPPGQIHRKHRSRPGEYKLRLMEKQKVRLNYGVLESQLRRLIVEAKRSREPTGAVALRFLEQRLDNIVFRLAFAPTIPAARQLVTHGHILVDGDRVDIPSYRVQPGQKVSLKEKSRGLDTISASLSKPTLNLPLYLGFELETYTGTMTKLPTRDDTPLVIDDQLLVEYYAQKL